MRLDLAADFAVTLTDRPLAHAPRYSLSGAYVTASPHTGQPSHEVLLSETFGSVDWLWSGDDEFRFDKGDRSLRGCTLTVPEEALEGWDPHAWTDVPPTAGSMTALTEANFDAKPTSERWVSESGAHLVCAHRRPPAPVHDILRLRIAPDLDLVFADRAYVGWILNCPADHLVREWEPAPSAPAPASMASVLRNYLTTVIEPKIDRMQDGDPALLAELDTLLARIAALPADLRRDVLHDQVIDLRENWYGDN
ncbi:hypothetical protein AB0G73_36260 [Streptomyces sp. NPDC020719]|uniref:hypothetical protein n=1 Tax=Streptomyces sp. NPDC020719 TaxID=3154896 RepID=UPI0033D74614